MDITPEIANRLVQVRKFYSHSSCCIDQFIYFYKKKLKEENIEFIVAPYEADAQLAYLALNGLVDAVITEDSDLLVFGCPKVLFKLDKFGNGKEIKLERLSQCREPVSYDKFDQRLFRRMCILSGCDYLPSIYGLGIKKCCNYVKNYKTISSVNPYFPSRDELLNLFYIQTDCISHKTNWFICS